MTFSSMDSFVGKFSAVLMLEVKVLLSLPLVVLTPFLGYGILVNQDVNRAKCC